MTTTITENPPGRTKQAGSGLDFDSAARELLAGVLSPTTFDRAALAVAVAAFPPPRDCGQLVGSGTWGVVDSFTGVDQERKSTVYGGFGLGLREGRTFRLALGPGVAICSSFDATRRDRTAERVLAGAHREVDFVIGRPLLKPWREDSGTPQGVVVKWSSKSRNRMLKAFASVDWSDLSRCYCGELMAAPCHTLVGAELCDLGDPMPLGMLTLTYPGDWLAVAPTGAAAKRHLANFRRRWAHDLGWRLDGAWKEEFQDRGAPHFHLLAQVPALVDGLPFAWWLSKTWADVVGADGWALGYGPSYDRDARYSEYVKHLMAGTGVDFSKTARMSDPKRCAVYFLKHSTKTVGDKEYQHVVPEAWQAPGAGPGRFWGFWGLKAATTTLDLDLGDFVTVRRVLRKVARARARSVKYSRAYHAARTCGRGECESVRLGIDSARGRKLRTLGVGGQLSGGWIVVNDGPALAGALARCVKLRRLYEVDLWNDGQPLEWLESVGGL